MKIEIPDAEAMERLGSELARHCPSGAAFFLQGELGAGKTTLARGFLRRLGHTGIVKSPTYTLVEPYFLKDQDVYHFDLYRLNTLEELESIGLRDYFDGRGISLIEWPEKAKELLDPPDVWLTIEFQGSSRQVQLLAHTATGTDIVKKLG